jgi:type II secretory pathway pseudopilin PulG
MNVRANAIKMAAFAAAAVAVWLGARLVDRYRQAERERKIRGDLAAIGNVIETYMQVSGQYPSLMEEIVMDPKSFGDSPGVTKDQAIDPWGREYRFETETTGRPRVYCLGRDGKRGGTGEDQDFEWPEPAVARP